MIDDVTFGHSRSITSLLVGPKMCAILRSGSWCEKFGNCWSRKRSIGPCAFCACVAMECYWLIRAKGKNPRIALERNSEITAFFSF